ncbi:HpcH/HpaI aldolase/citrate lyase family protein [Candidatus Riflebacteria bacterium]
MLIKSHIRKKIKAGKPVIGTWNTLAAPMVTEVIARGGFDFQIIDLEHGPFIIDRIFAHVNACEIFDCSPIVRLPVNKEWMILQALDQGAHGVIVPHVNSGDDVHKLLRATRYSPKGERGFTPFSKAGGFTNQGVSEFVELSNELPVSAIIVESKEGLDNLDEILKIAELDIVYFGAYDISQILGYPGQVNHPEVVKTISAGVSRVKEAGKYAGGFVPQSKNDLKRLLQMGMNFITYEVDCSILYSKINEVKNWFEKECE